MKEGIIVASDISQEWLLPWWWENYQKHNHYPVAFIDLGMTFEKKSWCKDKGQLIPLRVFADYVKTREEIEKSVYEKWEQECGNGCWESRDAWFKKPLACLATPFEKTIWIDLDCEVLGSLSLLFEYAKLGLSMAKDQTDTSIYNSGVIAYKKSHPAIEQWAQWCVEKTHLFRGDQEVFSAMIDEKKIKVHEIPPIYNYSRMLAGEKNAVIVHWHGPHGKAAIRLMQQQKALP